MHLVTKLGIPATYELKMRLMCACGLGLCSQVSCSDSEFLPVSAQMLELCGVPEPLYPCILSLAMANAGKMQKMPAWHLMDEPGQFTAFLPIAPTS